MGRTGLARLILLASLAQEGSLEYAAVGTDGDFEDGFATRDMGMLHRVTGSIYIVLNQSSKDLFGGVRDERLSCSEILEETFVHYNWRLAFAHASASSNCWDKCRTGAPCTETAQQTCIACLNGLARQIRNTQRDVQSTVSDNERTAGAWLTHLATLYSDILRTGPTVRAQLQRLSSKLRYRLDMELAIEHRERAARYSSRIDPMPTAVPRVFEHSTAGLQPHYGGTGTAEGVLPESDAALALLLRIAEERRSSSPSPSPTAAGSTGRGRGTDSMPVLGGKAGAALHSAGRTRQGQEGEKDEVDVQLSAVSLLQARATRLLLQSQALPLARLTGIGAVEDYRCHIIRTANVSLAQWLASEPGNAYAGDIDSPGTVAPGVSRQQAGYDVDVESFEKKVREMLRAQIGGGGKGSVQSKSTSASPRAQSSPGQGGAMNRQSESGQQAAQGAALMFGGAMWDADGLFPSLSGSSTRERVVSAREGGGEEVGYSIDPNGPLPSGYAASHCGGIARTMHLNSRKGKRAGLGILSPIFNAFNMQEARMAALVRVLQVTGLVLSPVRAVAWAAMWTGQRLYAPIGLPLWGAGHRVARGLHGAAESSAGAACRSFPNQCSTAADIWQGVYEKVATATSIVYTTVVPELHRFGIIRFCFSAAWAAGVVWDSPSHALNYVLPGLDMGYHRAEVQVIGLVQDHMRQLEAQWRELEEEAQQRQWLLNATVGGQGSLLAEYESSVQACYGIDFQGSCKRGVRQGHDAVESFLRATLTVQQYTREDVTDGRSIGCRWAEVPDPSSQHDESAIPAPPLGQTHGSVGALYLVLATGACYETLSALDGHTYTLCPFRHMEEEFNGTAMARHSWCGWHTSDLSRCLWSPHGINLVGWHEAGRHDIQTCLGSFHDILRDMRRMRYGDHLSVSVLCGRESRLEHSHTRTDGDWLAQFTLTTPLACTTQQADLLASWAQALEELTVPPA